MKKERFIVEEQGYGCADIMTIYDNETKVEYIIVSNSVGGMVKISEQSKTNP